MGQGGLEGTGGTGGDGESGTRGIRGDKAGNGTKGIGGDRRIRMGPAEQDKGDRRGQRGQGSVWKGESGRGECVGTDGMGQRGWGGRGQREGGDGSGGRSEGTEGTGGEDGTGRAGQGGPEWAGHGTGGPDGTAWGHRKGQDGGETGTGRESSRVPVEAAVPRRESCARETGKRQGQESREGMRQRARDEDRDGMKGTGRAGSRCSHPPPVVPDPRGCPQHTPDPELTGESGRGALTGLGTLGTPRGSCAGWVRGPAPTGAHTLTHVQTRVPGAQGRGQGTRGVPSR